MTTIITILAALALGAALLVLALFQWKRMIWAVLFLVVFEGALRKWVLPGFQAQIYLLKDIILLCAYIGFLASRGRGNQLKEINEINGLRILAILTTGYCLVQLFNPYSPSLLLSIVGLKNYLLYMPLAFIVPYLFSTEADFERKLRTYAIVMVPFAALGIVQSFFPPDHWINGYLSYADENLRAASLFGSEGLEKARASGTFSFIGGFVTFLTVMCYLGIGLTASKGWRLAGNLGPFALIIVTLAAMFTTGSRTPIYGLVVTIPIVVLVWAYRGAISTQHLVRVGFVFILAMVIVQLIVPDAIDAYEFRAATSDDATTRLLSPFAEWYGAFIETPITGLGMGSNAASAVSVMGTATYWWLDGQVFEVETARVLQEIGLIGFALVYLTRVWLVVQSIKLTIRFRTPLYSAMSGVIALFFIQSLTLFVVNNPTAGIFYWFSAGLIFAMCRLEVEQLRGEVASRPRAVFATRVGKVPTPVGKQRGLQGG
jgi:hypothetical protein